MSALLLFQRSSMDARLIGAVFVPGPDDAGAMFHSSSAVFIEVLGLATVDMEVGAIAFGGVEAIDPEGIGDVAASLVGVSIEFMGEAWGDSNRSAMPIDMLDGFIAHDLQPLPHIEQQPVSDSATKQRGMTSFMSGRSYLG